jgi:hypothetical protein
MNRTRTVDATAEEILATNPDPVVKYRLLRDVLRRAADSPKVVTARKALDGSHWVQLLASEQCSDGGWGRFHSRNYQSKQKTPTTEFGVERALALGLNARHPILRKTAKYIAGILQGKVEFPDRAEKNDRWPTAVKMIAGAKLARIQPDSPVLDEVRQLWSAIVQRSFPGGNFNPEAEIRAHEDLTGVRSAIGCLQLRNKYAVTLIGSRAGKLPKRVERAYIHSLWGNPRGLGYLDTPLHRLPQGNTAFRINAWFTSMELLSAFPSWNKLAAGSIDWLWRKRDEHGLWDFGPRGSESSYFPLSESWRHKMARQHDWSTRVLALLRKYYDPEH